MQCAQVRRTPEGEMQVAVPAEEWAKMRVASMGEEGVDERGEGEKEGGRETVWDCSQARLRRRGDRREAVGGLRSVHGRGQMEKSAVGCEDGDGCCGVDKSVGGGAGGGGAWDRVELRVWYRRGGVSAVRSMI